jgi:uncharacterized membrane protein
VRNGAVLTPRPTVRVPALLGVLVAAVVGLQIGYPLVHGDARDRMTVLIVALFALTCVVHAAVTRGFATAVRMLVVTAGLGYAVELLGVNTGFPFGTYTYSDALGARLFGVPPVIGLAWTMLAWPAAAAARALVRGPAARVLVGAWALASADLFLDPQLVATGAWHWSDPAPHLPGLPQIPLTNYAGWLLVALLVSAATQAVAGTGPDAVAIGLYVWLWAGWTVAQAAFLDLRASAAWGAVGMGLVAVPLVVSPVLRQRRC